MTDISNAVPEGFAPLTRSSPVSDLLGPIYQKVDGRERVFAIRAEHKHCNARGQIHGGVLGTLADIAMGYCTATSTEPPTPMVTVNLSIDFAGKADQGDWIEIHTDIQKVGRRLAFASCHFHVGATRIARASAVFSIPSKA